MTLRLSEAEWAALDVDPLTIPDLPELPELPEPGLTIVDAAVYGVFAWVLATAVTAAAFVIVALVAAWKGNR